LADIAILVEELYVCGEREIFGAVDGRNGVQRSAETDGCTEGHHLSHSAFYSLTEKIAYRVWTQRFWVAADYPDLEEVLDPKERPIHIRLRPRNHYLAELPRHRYDDIDLAASITETKTIIGEEEASLDAVIRKKA